MATTADFRNGLCFNHNGEPWKIESFLHVKPGKGPAFVRTKIRNLNTGRLLENTFTSGVKIDVIRVENRKYQFLYSEENDYHLMNIDDYEQIIMQKDFIEYVQFLKEGENIDRALKRFKRKFLKTGTLKTLRAKKQYIKKSERLRIKKQKAVYSEIVLRDSE